jgi:Secretion system C-terminal sorting domain
MKKILTTLLLIFFTALCQAQSTYFSKTYKLPNSEYADGMMRCSDGLILLSNTQGKAHTEIIKTDFEGNVIWKRSRRYWVALDMKVVRDTIYYASHNVYDTEGKNDLLFHAMTINGDSIFTRYYGTDAYEDIKEFQATEDGGFIFAGIRNWDSVKVNKDKLIIFKVDKNGKFQWEKHIGEATKVHDIRISRFEKMPNDEYLVIYLAYEKTEYKNLITKIKGDGTILINNKEFYNDTIYEAAVNVKSVSGNRLFGMVAVNDNSKPWPFTRFPSRMVLLDKDLNYLKKSSIFHDTFPAILWEYYELPNGDFLACGPNRNTDTSYQVTLDGNWLACFDKNLNLKWDRIIIDWRYDHPTYIDGFNDLTPLPNGDIAVFGDTYMPGDVSKWNLWLLRVDSMGCPKPNCKGRLQNITYQSTGIEKEWSGELPNVKIFPNPTNDKLWLELFDESFTTQIRMSIFDTFGRFIEQKTLQSSDAIFEFDVGHLSAGTYFLRVQNEKGDYTLRKFVKF